MAVSIERGERDVVTETADKPILASIREEWGWVKRGIEEILQEQPKLTYRAEDVYAACLNGDAYLWVFPEGFLISTAEKDEYSGEHIFFFWLAWVKKRGGKTVFTKYVPFFLNIAKEMGFKRIETRTPVLELERSFLADGWERQSAIYTREVQ